MGLVAGSASAGLIHENPNAEAATVASSSGKLSAPVGSVLDQGLILRYSPVTDLAKTIFLTNPVRVPEPSALLLLVPALGALFAVRRRAKR
jgi:hypothetical protein